MKKMKTMKRIGALVLAVVMAMALAVPAYAADSYKLTINNTVKDHTYTAYQIFAGTKASSDADDDKLGDTTWGADITDAGKDALYQAYGMTVAAADRDKSENILKLVDAIANQYVKDNNGAYALVDGKYVTPAPADYNGDKYAPMGESDKAVKFANVFFTTTTTTNENGGLLNDVTVNEGLLNAPAAGQIKKATGETTEFTGLNAGYYLINDSYTPKDGEENGVDYSIARIAVQVIGDTVINNKADKPTLDKTIEVQRNGATVDVDTSNGSIGDKVQYRLDSKVPNMEGYQSYLYEVTDTMTKGLTFNDDVSIVIKGTTDTTLSRVYKGNDGFFYTTAAKAETALEADRVTTGFTVESTTNSETGVTTVKIYVVNFIQYQDKAGSEVQVKYSATINQDALDTSATANNGQENKAKLTYSNHPEDSGKGENNEPKTTNPTGETPDSTVKTYTHGIEIFKVDAQNTNTKLSGAVFTISGDAQNVTIANGQMYVQMTDDEATAWAADGGAVYYMLKDGSYTTTVAGSEVDGATVSADNYVSTTAKYKQITTVTREQNSSTTTTAIATSDTNGYIHFTGLGEGVYTITETKAPVGYNILTDPIYVAIKFTVDEDTGDGSYTAYKYIGSSTSAPAMPADPASDTTNWQALTQNSEVKIESDLQIGNNAGTELPETGGIGTKIFYTMGAVLVVGAGVVLVSRKRAGE
jgi:fimbrial isopeptide formation D2 family protein/LPXTG-motif cell wall-anchored protein